jgi:acyl carrier protein
MSSPTTQAIVEEAGGLIGEIGALIQDKLGVDARSVAHEDLIASGVLDSLTLIQLLVDLETHFGITIPLQELEIDDVRSVPVLAELVYRRRFDSAGHAARNGEEL